MSGFLSFAASVLLAASGAATNAPPHAVAADRLFPFVMDAVPSEGVADVSGLVPAPAGRDGRVRRVGDHFETDAGRIRLNGMNLTGSANFPSRKQAERLALGLARRGVNCVRLHYMDADYGNFMQPPEAGFCEPDGTLRPEQLDRLDYLVSEFKRRGIYVDLNLQVMRLGKQKAATMFDEGLMADQKAFARRMFEHVNPYTKMAWRDDPVVAIVELSNEDGVAPYYARDAKHRMPEFARFCIGLEKRHLAELRRYLREELGVKAPITSTCVPFVSPYSMAGGDYIDYHDYWCHPSPISAEWKCMDEPLVNVTATDWFSPALAAGRRVKGLPFTVSEYGHPYPSYYGAEGQPMMRALAAFQGWDAVFTYSWANRGDIEPDHVEYFFSVSARPDVLAHMPASAAMYLRGDVAPCREWISVPLSERDYVAGYYETNTSWCKSADVQQASRAKVRFEHGLLHGLALDITGKDPMPAEQPRPGLRLVSDTGEIIWDRTQEGAGYGIVDAPNVKFFTGFAKGRTFDLHGVKLAVGATARDWATVSLLSHGANGFGGGARVLLAATAYCRNAGAKDTICEVDGDGMRQIATRGSDWGTGPVMCEGVPLSMTFAGAARARAWALDPSGARRSELSVCGNRVTVRPEDRSVWYEIALE